MTKANKRRELEAAISLNDAREVEIQLFSLVYHGAGVYEARGVSDAGLSAADLNRVYDALPAGSEWRAMICDALIF